MSIDNEHEQHEKLIQLIREALQQDSQLRTKHEVGEKFRFVRDRLQTILERLEKHLPAAAPDEENIAAQVDDEVVVYVYLYNAQGVALRSWSAMLVPKVFYEHSVNRPVYAEKSHIDALIRSKANKVQHGCLAIIVKRHDIVLPVESSKLQDALGNPLIKVKEGSLRFDKLVAFTHNGEDYLINAQGEFEKKIR